VAGQKGFGAGVGNIFIGGELVPARRSQGQKAAAAVLRIGPGLNQPFLEDEIIAKLCNVCAAMADGVEHTGRAKRSCAPKKGIIERANLGGDSTGKTAETGNGIERHDS
jgi:hypothetical protein